MVTLLLDFRKSIIKTVFSVTLTCVHFNLTGNGFDDKAAQILAEAIQVSCNHVWSDFLVSL